MFIINLKLVQCNSSIINVIRVRIKYKISFWIDFNLTIDWLKYSFIKIKAI